MRTFNLFTSVDESEFRRAFNSVLPFLPMSTTECSTEQQNVVGVDGAQRFSRRTVGTGSGPGKTVHKRPPFVSEDRLQ